MFSADDYGLQQYMQILCEPNLAPRCGGFVLGLATKLDLRGRYFAVAAAQHPEMFRPMRLPVLPICLLGALIFPVIEFTNA